MNPLEQTLSIVEQEQKRIPELVLAVQQAQGQKRVIAAELLQKTVGDNKLIRPVFDALDRDVRRIEPIDILDALWDLQTNVIWSGRPTERVHQIKSVMARYLFDTGIAEVMPERSQAWHQEFAGYSESEKLLKFFHRWFGEWERIRFAIEDGLIKSPIDAFKWQQQGKPIKFRWGKRFFRRVQRKLPPIVREELEIDSEYRIDVFSPRPQALVKTEGK